MEKKIVNLTLGGRGFYFFFLKKKSNWNKFLYRNNTFKPLTHPHTIIEIERMLLQFTDKYANTHCNSCIGPQGYIELSIMNQVINQSFLADMIMISIVILLATPIHVRLVKYHARKKYVYTIKLNPKVLEYNKC